ncbi:MAG: hypothetical protein RBG13Loki_0839 [Promethearchaeota archaeon CR_4]|nr:MAG: hypothetical protein RBG13Loki_0839 [Candidatus Lokiarchaeota archaeon CR_4]
MQSQLHQYDTGIFIWSPLRALMKRKGANIVARDAVDVLIAQQEEEATALTKQAFNFAEHAKHKKITKDNILLAFK